MFTKSKIKKNNQALLLAGLITKRQGYRLPVARVYLEDQRVYFRGNSFADIVIRLQWVA